MRPKTPAHALPPGERRRLLGPPWRQVILALAVAGVLGNVVWFEIAEAAEDRRDEAERLIRAEEFALRRLVPAELLWREPPPLPDVPPLALAGAERSRVGELREQDPTTWEPADRAWITELAARERGTLDLLASRGEEAFGDDAPQRVLQLIQTQNLLLLAGRAALLEGDEDGFLVGLETRLDLGERLMLQPSLLGPLIGLAIATGALDDVHLAVERPETSGATLARLDGLVGHWQLTVPDAATLVAREALGTIERSREWERADLDGAGPVFLAPVVEDFATLARACRSGSCRDALDRIADPEGWGEDPERTVAEMLMPNILSAFRKIEALEELVALARLGLGLRLDALERGSYPSDLTALAAAAGLGPSAAEGLTYEAGPAGAARLRFAPAGFEQTWFHRSREMAERLLDWELPAAARGAGTDGSPSARKEHR